MKNGKCKLLILSLIAALTLSSLAGCGGKKDDNSSSSESSDSSSAESTVDPESLVKQPVQFYYPTDSSEEMVTENPLDAEDNTKSASESSDSSSSSDNSEESNEETTQYVNVTDANGENVTDSNGENVTEVVKVTSASNNSGNSSSDSNAETATKYVAVTDANGENVVDENGETVTEAVKVTEASNSSSNDNNNNNNDNSSTSGNSDDSSSSGGDASTYTSYMQDSWAMWIDISKDEDYIFQGEFIEVTFKIKDSTPDGVYNVDITNPDFANLVNGGTTVTPDTVVGGKVFVNQEAEEQREFTDADGFAVYGDYVSAKQGDEVTFRFYMNNNPGLVAINFHFEYDMNAMDIVSCKTVGEFAAISDTSFSENENNLVQ